MDIDLYFNQMKNNFITQVQRDFNLIHNEFGINNRNDEKIPNLSSAYAYGVISGMCTAIKLNDKNEWHSLVDNQNELPNDNKSVILCIDKIYAIGCYDQSSRYWYILRDWMGEGSYPLTILKVTKWKNF